METNDFLLYNEVVYRLHACQSMEAFKPTLLSQVKLLIPYAYGTFIPIHTDPETQQAAHGEPYCLPRSFTPMEEKWLQMADRGYSLWMSYAPEPTVTRDSELLAGDSRFDTPSYRHIYQDWRVYDCLQMTIALAGRTMGRLAFYRTRQRGPSPTRTSSPSGPWPTTLAWPAPGASRGRAAASGAPWPSSSRPMASPGGRGRFWASSSGTRTTRRSSPGSPSPGTPCSSTCRTSIASAACPPGGTCGSWGDKSTAQQQGRLREPLRVPPAALWRLVKLQNFRATSRQKAAPVSNIPSSKAKLSAWRAGAGPQPRKKNSPGRCRWYQEKSSEIITGFSSS